MLLDNVRILKERLKKKCTNEPTVKFVVNDYIGESDLLNWCQTHGLTLDTDIKRFYIRSNGFCLEWWQDSNNCNVRGRIKINSIKQLKRLVFNEPEYIHSIISEKIKKTHYEIFNEKYKIFIIESLGKLGQVCLILSHFSQKIFLIDQLFKFYYISDTINEYIDTSFIFFGIIGWQLLYTKQKLSSKLLLTLHIYVPENLKKIYENENMKCQE
ncbi:hypothetical protein A3Q56_05783 [Intoshia linei]|uniref:Uncharacterized protein n=1 Tax=Intoshia linei TaxID=1819745 RepID=A0A177AWT7_9BILA|nr:hypothetical protein A3Q56_05783 [Intoshia linei]